MSDIALFVQIFARSPFRTLPKSTESCKHKKIMAASGLREDRSGTSGASTDSMRVPRAYCTPLQQNRDTSVQADERTLARAPKPQVVFTGQE